MLIINKCSFVIFLINIIINLSYQNEIIQLQKSNIYDTNNKYNKYQNMNESTNNNDIFIGFLAGYGHSKVIYYPCIIIKYINNNNI